MSSRLFGAIAVLALVAACSSSSDNAGEIGLRVEQLFTGGLIVDGSGSAPFLADLGISADKIVFIGEAESAGVQSDEIFDVAGHWVTPGFIDAHSHAMLDLDYGRDAAPFLYQGITSVVLGVDGIGENIARRMQLWRANGIGVNGILFIGHGAIREQVMGRDDREPNADEMQAMHELVRQGMEEGALAQKMRLFIFDDPVITPEFAIRSFTGLAADFYRLPDRGYLREGYVADITILDPERYRDKATFEQPRLYTEGVAHVLVNGTFAVRDGKATGAMAGVAISRPME